jgi:two-component system LytT family response regulator
MSKAEQKINALIIDDELHCRSSLRKQLEWSCPEINIIGEAHDATSGYTQINELKPDLIFLDVEMPDQNGFDLLKRFDQHDFEVIFTTAYDSFALEAFRVNAVDYLLKPIEEDQLLMAIEKVKIYYRNKNPQRIIDDILNNYQHVPLTNKIAFPTSEGITFLPLNEIIRCEGEGSYSKIFSKNGESLFIAKTLKYIEELCNSKHLLRIHQSHLINVAFVDKYMKHDGGSILMQDGTSVPISRSKKEVWQEWVKR